MLTFLFWLLAFASIYSYFIYPILLKIIPIFLRKSVDKNFSPIAKSDHLPSISLIIAAFNEEKRIREKLENSLLIDFDGTSYEIIVASDCSDDATDDIVRAYADKGIRLVRASARLGKENAQLEAIKQATGNILVFSDAATHIPSDAITKLIHYFNDPAIGAVSSEDRFVSKDGSIAGEGAYVKYEMWLRKQESQLAGLVGLSGSFFAARKEICVEWDISSSSDFNTAFNAARHGLRAVSAPDVLGYYQDLQDPSKEYRRKIRTVIRGMTGLSRHKEVMNINKYGLFAFQVISHKLMRWLAPWFFIGLFIISALIAGENSIYSLIFLGQLIFYGVALLAQFLPNLQTISLIKLIYFFVQVNIALLDASIKFLAGHRMSVWKPSER